jgi:glutamine synthetase
VKCFDESANPYLVAGSLLAAGISGIERNLTLPAEVTADPASLSDEEQEELGVRRLPQSLEEAVAHLEKSEVLHEAMGQVLFNAFVAVRRGEIDLFAGKDDEEIVAAHRWRY